ncbi:MAG TPA: amidohydrolase [Vicinamibacterales bacterium]|jgi:aminobenzoyl-glutamate utilization protein B
MPNPKPASALFLTVAVLLAIPAAAQDVPAAKRAALAETDRIAGDIARISSTLWKYSERALREQRSAAFLADILEREGFRVERGVAGMPTAFVASYGTGKPVIGILAEYDALPGIGNAVVPKKQAREDGVSSGQGCGHDLFGAGSVGAAIALKRTMAAQHLPGTLRLYGTPAEETGIGKIYMARDGAFDDLDAAIEWHPSQENAVANTANQAMNNFTVEFFGQPAHAAFDPWNGKSALDAVELFAHGLNMMREHVKPTSRIHYVFPSAGEAPNVVPSYASVWAYVRDVDRASVDAHYAWIQKIAEGAALATRTTYKVTLTTGLHEYVFNRPLQEAMQRNLEAVGGPKFGEAEQVFARQLQRELGLPESGIDTSIRTLADRVQPAEGGSTDVSDVSHITPTVGLSVATAGRELPWHSWATSASHGLPGASHAAETAASVIALTGVDLLTRPDLIKQARADFVKKTGGKPYKSPIPAGQKPPIPK